MSFGDVLVHLAGVNHYLCSTVSGTSEPKRSEVKVEAGKEKLVGRLREATLVRQSQGEPGPGGPGYGAGPGGSLQPAGHLSPAQRRPASDREAERGVAAGN
jgi:hypothetical protein